MLFDFWQQNVFQDCTDQFSDMLYGATKQMFASAELRHRSSHPLWKFPRSVHYEIYCLRWTCSPLAELSGEASSYFIHSMLPFGCPGIDVTVHVLLNRQISCKEKCTESTEHLFSCRLNCSFIFPGGRWSEINGNGANIKTFSLKLFSVLWR